MDEKIKKKVYINIILLISLYKIYQYYYIFQIQYIN